MILLHLNEKTIEAYQQKVKAKIKEMRAKTQMLEASAENSSADLHIQYQKILRDLKYRFKDIENNLDRFTNTTEENWGDIQSSIDKSMEELLITLEDATKQFNN